jgi:hypothetical protein
MIIQTLKCDFLIEGSGEMDGTLFIYSDSIDELQRLFGSSAVEYSSKPEWKYRALTCKQDFANALILIVKEIDYRNFSLPRMVLA